MLVQAYLRRPSKGATGKEKLKKASRKREPLLNIGQGEGQWAEERWSIPCCRKPLPSSRPEAVPGHSRGLSFVQPYLPLLQVSFNLCPSQAAFCRSSLPQTHVALIQLPGEEHLGAHASPPAGSEEEAAALCAHPHSFLRVSVISECGFTIK